MSRYSTSPLRERIQPIRYGCKMQAIFSSQPQVKQGLYGDWQVATCLEVEESLESSDVILHQCEILVLDCRADLHNGNGYCGMGMQEQEIAEV